MRLMQVDLVDRSRTDSAFQFEIIIHDRCEYAYFSGNNAEFNVGHYFFSLIITHIYKACKNNFLLKDLQNLFEIF